MYETLNEVLCEIQFDLFDKGHNPFCGKKISFITFTYFIDMILTVQR